MSARTAPAAWFGLRLPSLLLAALVLLPIVLVAIASLQPVADDSY